MPNKPPTPPTGLLKGKTGGIDHKWWLVGGVAVGGIAYMYYRHNANAAPTTTPAATDPNANTYDPTNDPYAGYDNTYGSSYGGAYGSGSGAFVDPAGTAAAVDSATALGNIAHAETKIASRPTSNTAWMHHAISRLEEKGYSPALARVAIHAYLVGAPLTTKQVHAVEAAIGLVGPPPFPVPAIHQVPVPKQTRKDARHHRRARRASTFTQANAQ